MDSIREKWEERIRNCEEDYIRYFSQATKEGDFIRYENAFLPDMYDHNFLRISPRINKEGLSELVREIYKQAKRSDKKFLNLKAYEPLRHEKGEVEHLGAYILQNTDDLHWKTRMDCCFKKVEDNESVKALIEFDTECDGRIYGEDFCRRRATHRGELYKSNQPCNCYLCYVDGRVVGKCDLFTDGDMAKIEDFVVKEAYQRKQIGTTILAYLIKEAALQGIHTVYLCADEEDTPKEMYQKLGFQKVTDFYGLLWHF